MVSATKDTEGAETSNTTKVGFVDAEESRRNPQAWLENEEMRSKFMKRIRHYETYLAKWGITAQTGIEQEFYVVTKLDENGKPEFPTIRKSSENPMDYFQHFPDSPFIEGLYRESHPNSYEIVVGTGYKYRKDAKKYPHPSLEPTVIVRATESAKKLISKEAEKPGNTYNSTGIDFDPTNHGRRPYAQQINISLWDSKNKQPLFNNNGVNELSSVCIKNMLEAQNASIAFYTVNQNAFKRFAAVNPKVGYFKNSLGIRLQKSKYDAPSVLWRDINACYGGQEGKYGYIENRLGSSDMPPYVNMLITLAGAAEGVREYVEKNNIKSKEELLEKVQSGNKEMNRHGDDEEAYTKLTDEDCKKYPAYELPKTQKEALKTTESSKIAKEILGDDLYDKFIKGYKEHCLSGQAKGK